MSWWIFFTLAIVTLTSIVLLGIDHPRWKKPNNAGHIIKDMSNKVDNPSFLKPESLPKIAEPKKRAHESRICQNSPLQTVQTILGTHRRSMLDVLGGD